MDIDDFDKKYAIIIYSILILTITFFTIVHHLFPWILSVPDANLGPYLFPENLRLFELIFWDSTAIILSTILYHYMIKKHGFWLASLFLTGSVIFTGLEECMWIYGGRFGWTYPTYFFTKAGLWFFDIPVYTCLGWFILAYCCVFIAEKLTEQKKVILTAGLGGLFAVMVDLWIDPLNVNLGEIALNTGAKGNWVWEMTNTLDIFSIPFMNFLGWFLVIFLFAALWGKVRIKFENNEWDKKKGTLIFYGMIPLLLLTCLITLYSVEMFIIKPFFANINIPFPVGEL
ncbi:MAG: carotenoid biosynthesis protein [Candidatus Lokiarchaeota archaeon]|nr:carotenoid biosynthesis protein [Candidatus Lokiarchaeota archaeon]